MTHPKHGPTHQWRGVIEEYRDLLDIPEDVPAVTLREGGTPLVPSAWLSGISGAQVWLKVEGDNPTGSFKDRGMTTAISVAAADGAQAVVCASTGNTSASMAAYAARAGLKPLVLVPQGKIAAGKMAQAIVHGAQVIMVRGNFDDCLRMARELAWHYPVALVNSVNPVRLEGQKTAAFEIVDFLGDAPDVHVLPVGNAGNISAYWLGYTQYLDLGHATRRPVMRGYQAAGAAPLVTGEPFPDPETKATAIRIGNPASWKLAEAARDESGGRFEAVTDDQILAAQRDLAAREGVFVEPASAAGVAGLLQALRGGGVLRRADGRDHGDGPRAQGHRHRARRFRPDHRLRRGRRRRGRGRRGRPRAFVGGVSAVGFVEGAVAVSVPATSANLGPGFDSLGLALDLRDELTAEAVADGLVVEVEGEGATTLALDEGHLVVRSMWAAFAAMQVAPPGVRLHCHNVIPHARGLGSSSAAIVGGLALARALVEDGAARLSDQGLFALAADLEGHPDNVAPACFGGFVVCGREADAWYAARSRVDPRLRTVVFVPPTGLSTELARGLLPAAVPHADAAADAGAGRTAGGGPRRVASAPVRRDPRLPPPGLPAGGDARVALPGRRAAGRRRRRGGLRGRADRARRSPRTAYPACPLPTTCCPAAPTAGGRAHSGSTRAAYESSVDATPGHAWC